MKPRLRNTLLWSAACAAAWGAGFALQKLQRVNPPGPAAAQTAAPGTPTPREGAGPGGAAPLLAARTSWERRLALERLAASLEPEDWPSVMRELQRADRGLAQSLLLRWLEADMEAALSFVAESTRGSGLEGRNAALAGLERVAVRYLAAADPERGWGWTGELQAHFSGRCRAELLAALCEHDPAAAARFVAAHGDSAAAWGVAFPDMTAVSAGPAVRALATEPESLLNRRMLLHTMSAWGSKDFGSALGWWRSQPPRVQGLTLRGLGMALHILSPTEKSFLSKGSVKLFPADLTAMADTAMEHASPEDRRDFLARFLIHMSPTDPLKAAEWVAENLHGQERRERLGSALAYIKPQGALEVVRAWERLPQSGWPDHVFREVGENAARADPERTLAWALKLPASQGGEAATAAGYAWGEQDAAAARRRAEALTNDSPASLAFTAGVAGSLISAGGGADSFGPGTKFSPAEVSEKMMAPAWEWAAALPGARGAAALETVLNSWVEGDAAGAARAVSQLTAPETRAAGLRAVTERFFSKEPEAALTWAKELGAGDRETVRAAITASRLPEARKTEALANMAAQEDGAR